VSSSGRENEIKLAAPDVATAQNWLRDAGFVVSKPRVFESNTLFDTAEGRLRQQQQLLRLRSAGFDFVITYKGPPDPGPHKSREEWETKFEDHRAMAAIFDRLGYVPVFIYEKYRTEFQKLGEEDGLATLDETPIGVFVELEGTPEWVDRTAAQMGFAQTEYILASYGKLYSQWAQSRGIERRHMVFSQS